jgi:hypothetical protein
VILVEVKLWSPKSGHGENDQLMRYLCIADDLHNLEPTVPADSTAVVMYLTPRDSTAEVRESLCIYGDSDSSRRRLFRLQWQDCVDAAEQCIPRETDQNRVIVSDVMGFLRQRGLEYFNGFCLVNGLEQLEASHGPFYTEGRAFDGFEQVQGIGEVKVVKGAWCNGN